MQRECEGAFREEERAIGPKRKRGAQREGVTQREGEVAGRERKRGRGIAMD